MNRVSASREEWARVIIVGENITYSPTVNAFNATATAVFPRAVEYPNDFNVSVLFTVVLPANAIYFTARITDLSFFDARYWRIAWGSEGYEKVMTVNGSSTGGTGVAAWNLAVNFDGLFCSILRQSNWLSFTSGVEAHPIIDVVCNVELNVSYTSRFGTFPLKLNYTLHPWFDLLQENATFYRFEYPIAAWPGYGTSVLVAVVSLCLFVGVRVKNSARVARWW